MSCLFEYLARGVKLNVVKKRNQWFLLPARVAGDPGSPPKGLRQIETIPDHGRKV